MDIANLGVAINPSKSVEGAARVKTALKEIGSTATTEMGKLDSSAKKAGESTKKMGKDAQVGLADFSRGILDALDTVGLMDNGIGTIIRRVMALGSTIQNMQALMAALSNSAGTVSASMNTAATTTSGVGDVLNASAAAMTGAGAAATTASAATATAASVVTASATAAAAATTAAGGGMVVMATGAATATASATSLTVSTTALTASTTALGGAAARSVPPMAMLNAVIQFCDRSLDGLNRKRLAFNSSRLIDVDARQVGDVQRLAGGMNQLAISGGRVPPVLNAAGSSGSVAATGMRIFGLSIGALTGIVAGVLAVLASLIAAFALLSTTINLVKQGMDLAGPVQLTTMSLETMTGSAYEANRVMDSLRETAKRTGADLTASSSTVKRFMALGFNPDDALKMNRSILDVAGSIGLSAEEAKGLGAALAQVQAKGIVSMEELRQQIAEKGVPIFDELQRKVGLFGPAFFKAVEQGKVPAKDLVDVFLNLEGGFAKFAGGAEKMTATMPGAVSRLKRIWEDLLITIGEPVNNALAPMVNQLSDMLTKLAPYAQAFGESLATGIRAIGAIISNGEITQLLGMALMAGIEFAAANMVTMMQLHIMGVVKLLTSALSGAVQFVVNSATDAFTTMINFIAQIITGDWSGAAGNVGSFFQNLFTGGGGIVSNIAKSIYNSVGQALTNAVNAFVQAFFRAWQAVSNAMASASAAFGVAPTGLGPVMPKPMTFEPIEIKFADIRGAANDLVGTSNRDALADFIAKRGEAPWNPELSGPPKPDPKLPISPTNPTGGGKSKVDEIPKAKEVKELDTQVQKLIKDWMDLGEQTDKVIASMAESISNNMTTGIMDMVKGTKDLKTAFSDMATSIINDIMRMVVQMYVQLAVASALKAMGYGGSGGAGVATAHTGGVAGSPNLTTSGGVASYHTGGMTTAESMVKVERGETILTKKRAGELEDQLSRRQGGGSKQSGGGGKTTIINVTDSAQVLDVIASNPDAIVNAISRRQPAVRQIVTSKERK